MKTSVFFLLASAALAQPGLFMSGSGDLKSGVVVRFRTMIEPPVKVSEMKAFTGSVGGGVNDGDDAVHRYMWDDKIYFGYDIAVTPVAGGYSVTFSPSTISTQRMFGKALTPAPQPKFPAPQLVPDGDTIALDLFVSPDGKHKIVDYIQILSPGKAAPPLPLTTSEPRNFTIDDGPVIFGIEPKMSYWIDGREYTDSSGFTGKPGSTFWIWVPGGPRYILSLAPAPGFEKAGAIRDNSIGFAADGHQYEIRFSGPIAGAGAAFNLYMLRDTTYTPKAEQMNEIVCGSGRLDKLIAR
jgi:hypothetical protein